MAYSFIPKYIQQVLAMRPRQTVTADRWNELFNLLIQQGDSNAAALAALFTYPLDDLVVGTGIKGVRLNASGQLEIFNGTTWSMPVVTKAQVGLPLADNTPDSQKPVSTPQQYALNGLKAYIDNIVWASAPFRFYTGPEAPSDPGPYMWLRPVDTIAAYLELGEEPGETLNLTMDGVTQEIINVESSPEGATYNYTIL